MRWYNSQRAVQCEVRTSKLFKMSAICDTLVEVPLSEWPHLRERLKVRWPSSIYAYYLLKYQERWIKGGCDVTKVFLPFGNWDNGIVIVSEVSNMLYCVTIIPTETNYKLLSKALIKTKVIDWSRPAGVIISCLHNSLKSCILEVYNTLNMKVMWQNPALCVYKSIDEARKSEYECPSDLYIAPLKKEHASQMNETWPHRFPGSEKFFSILIGFNGGHGLFTRSEDEMIAWVTQNDFGALGHLYCVEQQRRKGYAQLLTRLTEKRLAEEGEDVHAFIVKDNQSSLKLFQKMGYVVYEEVLWMCGVVKHNTQNEKED